MGRPIMGHEVTCMSEHDDEGLVEVEVSRSWTARARLPVAAGLLYESTDPVRRLAAAVAMQREIGVILRDDVLEAVAAGASWRDVAAVMRVPRATLQRVVEGGRPVSAIGARRGG